MANPTELKEKLRIAVSEGNEQEAARIRAELAKMVVNG